MRGVSKSLTCSAGPGHFDRGRTQPRGETSRLASVPVPSTLCISLVGKRCQNFGQFSFDQGQDHFSELPPQLIGQRIQSQQGFHFTHRWCRLLSHRRVPPRFCSASEQFCFSVPRGYAYLISTTRGTRPLCSLVSTYGGLRLPAAGRLAVLPARGKRGSVSTF